MTGSLMHLKDRDLIKFVDGETGRVHSWLIRRHLRNCPSCRKACEEVREVRQMLDFSLPVLEEAPEALGEIFEGLMRMASGNRAATVPSDGDVWPAARDLARYVGVRHAREIALAARREGTAEAMGREALPVLTAFLGKRATSAITLRIHDEYGILLGE